MSNVKLLIVLFAVLNEFDLLKGRQQVLFKMT